jgi:hypothetical protein
MRDRPTAERARITPRSREELTPFAPKKAFLIYEDNIRIRKEDSNEKPNQTSDSLD